MSSASRTASVTVTVALHLAGAAALLQLDAVRRPLLDAMPLMVSLVAPPPEPLPLVEPPKPLPVSRASPPRHAPAPLIAADAAAAASFVAPLAPPPEPIAPPASVAVAAAPVVPPSFNAAYLRNPPPAYPAMSRHRGEQGTVILRVFVGADGAAQKVLVRTTSGYERLDQAAHDAVHQWRFVPARQGEQAVAAWVLVPIRFALEN